MLEERLREQSEAIAAIPRQSSEVSESSAMLDVESHHEEPESEQQLPEYNTPYMPNAEIVEEHRSIDLTLERCTSSGYQYRENTADPPLTIPIGHQTGTGSLFAIEPIKSLIGAYPDAYFYHVEAARPPFNPVSYMHLPYHTNGLNLLRSHTDELVEAFFVDVHPHLPVIDRQYFMRLYESLDTQQVNSNISTALCLVIFALGQLSMRGYVSTGVESGFEYFSVAYRTLTNLWCGSFETELDLPIALLYVAQYFYYKVQPLPAWKMVHMASTQVQLIVSAYVTNLFQIERVC